MNNNERSVSSVEALKSDLDKAAGNLENTQRGKRVSIMAGGGIFIGILYAITTRKGFIGAVGYGMMGMALGTGIAAITGAFKTNGTA